ncbi:TetR/AcrR family transcriptional regulator [Sulfitobacter profundi]|uniref:TetR/AcrR family transcriptional regulator n=1 Tax=Sulfitobacter profundi TaxID=2679961 RepID=A0ABW1YYE5_9RHOB
MLIAIDEQAARRNGSRNACRTPGRHSRTAAAAGIARFQKLLDATEVILTKTPDSDISLAVVAEAAGVPLPSIYHFFPNKDAILVALAQRYHQALSTLAQKPLDPPPALGRKSSADDRSAGSHISTAILQRCVFSWGQGLAPKCAP